MNHLTHLSHSVSLHRQKDSFFTHFWVILSVYWPTMAQMTQMIHLGFSVKAKYSRTGSVPSDHARSGPPPPPPPECVNSVTTALFRLAQGVVYTVVNPSFFLLLFFFLQLHYIFHCTFVYRVIYRFWKKWLIITMRMVRDRVMYSAFWMPFSLKFHFHFTCIMRVQKKKKKKGDNPNWYPKADQISGST